jgi:hypothetical protein
MSFWGDIEHAVKDAAQLDPTVLTVEAFESAFKKKHKRKPNAAEKAQYQALKVKHGVGDVDPAAIQQAQDSLTMMNPLAPGAAHAAQQNLIKAQDASEKGSNLKAWGVVALVFWLIRRGRLR